MTTPTFDVRQNNWLLPLAGEDFQVDPLRQASLQIEINWTVPTIYWEMQGSFWHEYFEDWTTSELYRFSRLLKIRSKKNKKELTSALVKYFQLETGAAS